MARAGILLRKEIAGDLAAIAPDVVEIMVEHFLAPSGTDRARSIGRRWPVIAHGVDLSLGSEADWPAAEYDRRAEVLAASGAEWFGEHISFSRVPGRNIGHLVPLPFTVEAVRAVGRHARRVQARIPCPLLLENIAYYGLTGRAEMGEAEFVAAVLEESGCDLLLDLNNLYANSVNHGYDPRAWLDRVPLERVVEVHLAGGERQGRIFVDSHATAVGDPVWDLLEEVMSRAAPRAVVVERDSRFPAAGELAAEVERARRAHVPA